MDNELAYDEAFEDDTPAIESLAKLTVIVGWPMLKQLFKGRKNAPDIPES